MIYVGIIIITITGWVWTYMYMAKKCKYTCPYKNACLDYNDIRTKEAMARVVKLLIANIEIENRYKESLGEFIKNINKTD